MNFTHVLGFVVLRNVVKVFPVSSSSFARKTTGRNRARSHSGAWCGLKTKWDLKLSLPEQQLPSSSSTLSSSDSSGAWISSHFRIQVGSADECVAPGRCQPRETRWTSDRRLSSPEMNVKVGLLLLFFMQLLLSHMFLSFLVRNSPLNLYWFACRGRGNEGIWAHSIDGLAKDHGTNCLTVQARNHTTPGHLFWNSIFPPVHLIPMRYKYGQETVLTVC